MHQYSSLTRAKFEQPAVITDYDRTTTEGFFPFERYCLDRWFGSLSGRRVLDLGCGTGREALAFARERARVVAVDVASSMLEAARANAAEQGLAIAFHHTDCTDLSALGTFDLVFGTNNFIEHIPTRALRLQVLRQIAGAIAPGGMAILSAHDRELSMAKWGAFWEQQRKQVDEGLEMHGYRLEFGDKFLERVTPNDPGTVPLFLHIYSRAEALDDFAQAGLEVSGHGTVPELMEAAGIPMEPRFSRDVVFYGCIRKGWAS